MLVERETSLSGPVGELAEVDGDVHVEKFTGFHPNRAYRDAIFPPISRATAEPLPRFLVCACVFTGKNVWWCLSSVSVQARRDYTMCVYVSLVDEGAV